METRATTQTIRSDTPGVIIARVATFNYPTMIRDRGGREFRELIAPGAFSRSLRDQPDVRCLRDHDPSRILGRTKAGTLRVWEDTQGLNCECTLPQTEEAKNLVEAIKRGDVDSCSFGFEVEKDHWTKGEILTRELRDVNLYEVSIVSFPAYDGNATQVDLRSVNFNQELSRMKWVEAKIKLAKHRYK